MAEKNKGGLTVKQEKFAQAYVELGDKSAAYRKVFSCKNMTAKSVNERACVTSKILKVESRIKELQAATLKRHEITVDSLAAEYEEAKQLALKIERPEAAIKAIDGKARITGHDKKVLDHQSSDGSMSPRDFNDFYPDNKKG